MGRWFLGLPLLVHGGGQTLCLLIDEGAGARGTGSVGVEVGQFPAGSVMIDLGQGCVLPAHADHGPHIRLDVNRSQYLTDDLELVKRSQPFAEFLAVVPGESDGCDALPAEPFIKILG